jgi:thymidylate synthase (FAD)
MNLKNVGEGKVVLIAGGGKIYTDIAARFVRSERTLEDIISSSYDKKIVNNIINSGHKAAVEFDYFIFGVEGYARVTEVQLVRKRLASFMIKTGRAEKNGKRSFDVVMPKDIRDFSVNYPNFNANYVILPNGKTVAEELHIDFVELNIHANDILNMTEHWYNTGVDMGKKEEELRYLKPQATEFKAIIGMNAHSLLDWFTIRCCKNAQTEIRDMANKMMDLCKEAAPDIFKNAGPNCKVLGYCPENSLQHKDCQGKILTKDNALDILKRHCKEELCPLSIL